MSDVRKFFTSRFPGGRILELDFSQLEIYALAYLSNDEMLRKDLLSGADLHGISATNLFGPKYTKEQRKIAKQLSFQLQYGAGYKSMAATNNVSEETTKKFIKVYYDRYKGVKKFQDDLMEKVASLRETSDERTTSGKPAGIATLKSLTGRRYTFKETDAPDWAAMDTSFSPTQIKNFPVQGFATGDIVPLVLGKLYRFLVENDQKYRGTVLMINTVHDSVVFDCMNEKLAKDFALEAQRIMEDAPRYLNEYFEIDFDMPLKVEAEIGPNWHDMKPYDPVPF